MKENKELSGTLLMVVIAFLFVLMVDYALMNELVHPGIKFLKGFSKIHKNIFFVKFLYIALVYFYFSIMPRLRMKGGEGQKMSFISFSAILSMLILISGILTPLYGIYVYPILIFLHIPFAGFALAALRSGALKSENFFKDISNESSDFYFEFGCEDGTLTVHKPQQNFWIDGGPGSGKSDTFVKAIISQSAMRGYAGLVYDW